MPELPRIVAVVGTNASGKSSLGVRLAQRFGGEIVSADSRQVFRGLDLGSGKISPEEMRGVPHHLLGVCEPNDFFSMADFQALAYRAIDGILARGNVPFLVGGTGLYVASVTEGYQLSDRAPNLRYREELETKTTPELYEMLVSAAPGVEIDRNNRNRVMRALEKLESGDTKEPSREAKYRALKLGVSWDRETLKKRIDERLERRMQQGMVDEVRSLMENGATTEFLYKLGLEYRFISQYIHGEFETEDEMCQQLSLAIKRFAKRQMTWFRRDKEIRWLDMGGDPVAEASALIEGFLNI